MGAPDTTPVLVAGCGRSGTTWLGEIINYDNAFRVVFEPLRHDTGPDVARALGYWPYVRPDHRPQPLVEQVWDVLTGGWHSEWSDRFGRQESARCLVKEIRAHFLLGWMRASFPGMPMVFILRHPCAVAASEIRLGWTGWDQPMAALDARPDLVADHLAPYLDVIRAAATTFERRIALWCIRNIVPLQQLTRTDAAVVLYEELLVDPMATLTPLLAGLGRPVDEARIMEAWGRPSAMSMASDGSTPDDRVAGWVHSTTPEDRARAVAILRGFGLDRIYTDDPMPHMPSGEVLGERVDRR